MSEERGLEDLPALAASQQGLVDLGYAPDSRSEADEARAVREELEPPARRLAALREDIALGRRSVDDDPAREAQAALLYEFQLALQSAGRRHEALCSAEESVELLRQMAVPPAGALAQSLTSLSYLQQFAGRKETARETQEAALAVASRLAQEDPDDGLPLLADTLLALVSRHRALEQHVLAADTAAECVTVCRELVRTGAAAADFRLALALHAQTWALYRLERPAEALTVAREWVEVARNREARRDAVTQEAVQHLAEALSMVALQCNALSLYVETLQPAEEAIHLFRRKRQLSTNEFSLFAIVTLGYADALAVHHRPGEAMMAAGDAVVMLRELHRAEPAEHRHNFAVALHKLARYADAVGDRFVATNARREVRSL